MRTLIIAVAATALLWGAGISASPTRVDQLVRTALQLDPNIKRGGGLYEVHCVRCHLQGAIGDPHNVIPALAGQREAYLIKQLADFAELERDGDAMHAVVSKAALNQPQEWADLAGYLSQLPVVRFPETADGKGVELGEAEMPAPHSRAVAATAMMSVRMAQVFPRARRAGMGRSA
jgi:cytochrome c553